MLFVYTLGMAKANQYINPRMNPDPFAETYSLICVVRCDQLAKLTPEVMTCTHKISNKFTIELRDEQTQVGPQKQEESVSRDQEYFFTVTSWNDDVEDRSELTKELFVNANFGQRSRLSRGKEASVSRKGRQFSRMNDDLGYSSVGR